MLRIAKILKSHGTDGAVLVSAPEFDLTDFTEPVLIYFDGLPVPFFIENCSERGTGKYIIHLNDVNSLKDAEEMTGRDIFVESDETTESATDFDFTGWKVLDGEELIGTVESIEPIPGNLCLNIKPIDGSKDQFMIPLHEDFIDELDEQNQEMKLTLPEGLY